MIVVELIRLSGLDWVRGLSRLHDPGPSSLRTLPDETKKRLLASSSTQGTDRAVRFSNLWRRLESSVRPPSCYRVSIRKSSFLLPLTRPPPAPSMTLPEHPHSFFFPSSLPSCPLLPEPLDTSRPTDVHQPYHQHFLLLERRAQAEAGPSAERTELYG